MMVRRGIMIMYSNPVGREGTPFHERSALVVAPIDSRETVQDKAYAALRNESCPRHIARAPTSGSRAPARRISASRALQCARHGAARTRRLVRSGRGAASMSCATKHEVIELIRLGRAREPGSAPDHRARQRPGHRRLPAHVRDFEVTKLHTKLDDYSEVNIAFHQSIHRAQRQPGADRLRRTCSPPCA